jgi:hypothetical protein
MDGRAWDSVGPDAAGPDGPAGRVLSRRAVLVSAGALVLAGAGGVAAGTRAPLHHPAAPAPPAALVAALAAEDALIGGIDAAAPDPATRQLLAQLRADHVAHRRVLTGLIGAATGRSYSPTPSAPGPRTTSGAPRPAPRGRAELRAAEQRAAREGAARAAGLRGAPAALLASIAACETSHAELLG